jgi:UDP-2,3-diacylglucosamine pyrophosphatase LpxH
MRIFIVSDLHLGDGTPADDFSLKADALTHGEKLISFINDQNPDEIYFNGDIFELWQHRKKNIKKIHGPLVEFIEHDPRSVVLKGNHDYKLKGALTHSFQMNGKKILISHGFQNNPRMTSWFSRALCWILGIIERTFNPHIDTAYRRFINSLANTQVVEKTREYAETQLEDYDIVICGHTHHLLKEQLPNGLYANTSCCINGRLEGVLLETDADTVKVSLVERP